MLPVYEGLQFDRILEKGGRHKPWLILVNAENNLTLYVVKLFSFRETEKRDPVLNEVLGHVLAKEFGLKTPDAALINLDEEFIRSIDDPVIEEIFQNADPHIKFGSKYLYPVIEYRAGSLLAAEIKQHTEIDSVFAFDVLIRNGDRNNIRPNFCCMINRVT